MTSTFSRRRFLTAGGVCLGGALLRPNAYADVLSLIQESQPATSPAVKLAATTRTLEINGKAATVMGLLQPNGTQGMASVVNQPFRVELENKLTVPTAIHWHGLHPPNNQDGVPGVTQPVIRPDASTLYDFPLSACGHALDALPPGIAGSVSVCRRR